MCDPVPRSYCRAMTVALAPSAGVDHRRLVRVLGIVTVAASLVGAACAVFIIVFPAQVPEERYSYPFDAATYTATQSFFAVHHLGIVAGFLGLLVLAWPTATRPTRVGLVVSIVGFFALTACEIFAISAADALVGSSRADAVDNAFGIPMTVIGVGLVLAGIGLYRRPVLTGVGRWIVLALGVYVFVPMFPAVFGPMVLGRIAIGLWMLLFALLGLELVRSGGTQRRGVRRDGAADPVGVTGGQQVQEGAAQHGE